MNQTDRPHAAKAPGVPERLCRHPLLLAKAQPLVHEPMNSRVDQRKPKEPGSQLHDNAEWTDEQQYRPGPVKYNPLSITGGAHDRECTTVQSRQCESRANVRTMRYRATTEGVQPYRCDEEKAHES